MFIDIQFDEDWKQDFQHRLHQEGPWASFELYQLAYQAACEQLVPSFTGLKAPEHLYHIQPYDYQLETARRVVEEMNGKAILADEVGLGKTIEAGLILKEYMIRGLVKKALILAPASLVNQWSRELNQTFSIPAVVQRKAPVWEHADVAIASLDTAKRPPHNEIIQSIDYDCLIIDEAHKLKNDQTKNAAFVRSLQKKFCLLLTATPVQNRIEELYHLITILKPGWLGTKADFKKRYESGGDVQRLIHQVMIRNRRDETPVNWTKRNVINQTVTLSEEEEHLYESLCTLAEHAALPGFSRTLLKRELASSKEAAFLTLKEMDLPAEGLNAVFKKMQACSRNSKAEALLEFVQQEDEKVLVFTEYRATQLYLQWFLKQHGIPSVPYRGGFKRGKKDWMMQLFQGKVPVMIATEAGGEGLNLQFCHRLVNYDLPWNPMRLEQRIGRLHRHGQTKDVKVLNLAAEATIEADILARLQQKIGMFENVIGRIDAILGQSEDTKEQSYGR
ncbi:helicase-like protein [Salsuginibacillus halophilus]|uniref:Helicase-like protein n=1 Tax=Salsuginibacillus halophilus TaxID=517424 RepID=A0A2P8H826_9BACI|nr:SNF2-related protein [Salsuginibacillus halophilus]PSL42351.1 helicase-like protein [Salsuginibacillus halophilus]